MSGHGTKTPEADTTVESHTNATLTHKGLFYSLVLGCGEAGLEERALGDVRFHRAPAPEEARTFLFPPS